MKFNILKGATDIKLKSVIERRIYEYLETFEMKSFKRDEKLNLSSSEMQLRSFVSKNEMKKGIKDGFVVSVDCFSRYFIYFSRESLSMYLLKIQFDLNEIFGSDITGLMDIREEKISGETIGLDEADILMDNYLEWVKDESEAKETRLAEEKKEDEGSKLDIKEEELNRWFEKEE